MERQAADDWQAKKEKHMDRHRKVWQDLQFVLSLSLMRLYYAFSSSVTGLGAKAQEFDLVSRQCVYSPIHGEGRD